MRIAVVEPVGRGGLIHYTYQLCRGLAAAGGEVTLITDRRNEVGNLERTFELAPRLDLWDPKPPGKPPPRRRLGRRLQRALRYLREWTRLVAWLRRERFDVVLLGDLRFGLELPFLVWLRLGGDALLVDVCHNVTPFAVGRGSFRRRTFTRTLYRRIYALFDLVFVHFERNRTRFLEIYPLASDRVVALPMGDGSLFPELRDPSRQAADLRRELALDAEAPVVLLFGTLAAYKGVDLLVAAFPRVLRRVPDARLVVAGYPLPGFDLEAERARAEELGVGDAVRFVPRYLAAEEVGAWMELAAICAFPYREIFQSAAVQVPIAFDTPVVAADVGTLREALAGGEAGRLVPPGDPEALGDALAELLLDPAEAGHLARRATEIVRSRASWQRIGEQVYGCCERRLGATRRRPAEAER